MDDFSKMCLTLLTGVMIFVIGQIIVKFIIEPIHDLKKTLSETNFLLGFHAQAIFTPVGNKVAEDEASKALRKVACELSSKVATIPFYCFWSAISRGFLPGLKQINKSSSYLVAISTNVHGSERYKDNEKYINQIIQLLNFQGRKAQ